MSDGGDRPWNIHNLLALRVVNALFDLKCLDLSVMPSALAHKLDHQGDQRNQYHRAHAYADGQVCWRSCCLSRGAELPAVMR